MRIDIFHLKEKTFYSRGECQKELNHAVKTLCLYVVRTHYVVTMNYIP